MKKSDKIPHLRVSVARDASVMRPGKGAAVADCASAVAEIARMFVPEGEEREHFMMVMMDARRTVKAVTVVSIGTQSASLVHPRECFRPAIVAGAAAVVAVHNHPSGDPTPSSEDREATRRLSRAGELLGIPLADHVVLGADGAYFSFRENGIL